MPPELHEDFGEKIGGAKKDLWKDRGLYADDLDGMNEREAEKYVKKDNVWKKPDYQAMLDEGIPLGVVFFMKKARDSLNASPQYPYRDNTPEKRLDRQKQYIETVRELQAVVEGVRTVEDVMQVCDRFFLDNGYLEKRHGYGSTPAYQGTKKGSDNPVITNKLFRALRVHSPAEFERDYTRQAQKEQFGVAKDQKVPRGYELHLYDGKGYSRNRDWKEGTYYVTKSYSILQDNLSTREAALRWAQEHAKGRGKSGKQRFVPPQFEHITRTGPDYRNGQEIVGQHYLDTFGFRGGEFGNWLNQNDRQASLNMGFEALKDLAAALHVSDKDIAYQGTLAIAFGARGSGNAAAHYEPLRKVINLTKMHGAGSLAHEWWHGLDDYLGGKMGAKGFLSDNAHLYPPMKKLIDAMKFKAETPEQAAKRAEVQNARLVKQAEAWADSAMKYAVDRYGDDAVKEQYASLKAAFVSGEPGSVDKLSDLKKTISGHVIPKSERDQLHNYERIMREIKENPQPTPGKTPTDYYHNSKKMGENCERDGGYWESNVEMTARAFACYVKDRLPYQSDYLVGHAESCVTIAFDKSGHSEVIRAYPQGEERKAINAAFDEIVADLKLERIFTHTAEITALEASAIPLKDVAQLSLFGSDKPSVIGQLASAKAAEKAVPTPKKTHEPER